VRPAPDMKRFNQTTAAFLLILPARARALLRTIRPPLEETEKRVQNL
jgi:hypothetical protein